MENLKEKPESPKNKDFKGPFHSDVVIEEKKEENSLVIEKNENDYMTDEFLNDGEFSQRSQKSQANTVE